MHYAPVYAHDLLSTDLPFYKKYPKLMSFLRIIGGGILLASALVVGGLFLGSFTPAGVAAGDLIFTSTGEARR